MKKLLFISKHMEIGGMERALLNLLNTLCKRHYKITLILEEKKGPLLEYLDPDVEVLEYKLSYNKVVFFRKIVNFIHRFCWSIKNKNKYDFSCNFATYSIIGSYLALKASKNNALYIHSNYYEAYEHDIKMYKNFFDNVYAPCFNNLIFVSNESKNDFCRIYKELVNKCHVINNLIDYKNIQKLAKEKIEIVFEKSFNNFLFVGRIDNDSKNFVRMLKAFKLVISKNTNNRLYILGEGKDKDLCENLINEYKLNNNVFLLGKKINPYPFIKKCDAFLLTSNYEGYPVVLTECLVLNKPMISTINVSDTELFAQDYITIVSKKEKLIAKEILKFKKKKINYNIDFEEINKKRIEKIISIIE